MVSFPQVPPSEPLLLFPYFYVNLISRICVDKEESFWRRLWTCRQTEYWMNESGSVLAVWSPEHSDVFGKFIFLNLLLRLIYSHVASFQAPAAVYLKPLFFWDVTRRTLVVSYRSFNGQTVYKELLTDWPLKIGPIICPETSVNNCQLMPRNISEERRPLPVCYL